MTDTSPLISIIIPVYKVEPYLRQCLDSVLAQTYPHWEAICINDGSPDNCGAILDEYAAKDSRFIVIHQENQGVSVARNRGLEIMQGKYVTFIDPDDWIEHDTLEHIYNATKVGNAELIQFGRVNHEPDNITLIEYIPGKTFAANHNNYITLPFNINHRNDIPTYSATKAFLTSIIKKNNITYIPKVKIGEDCDFVLQYLASCLNITFINKPLYHYRRGVGVTDSMYNGNIKKEDIENLIPMFQITKTYKPNKHLPYQQKRAFYYFKLHALLGSYYSIKVNYKKFKKSNLSKIKLTNFPFNNTISLLIKTYSLSSLKFILKNLKELIKLHNI